MIFSGRLKYEVIIDIIIANFLVLRANVNHNLSFHLQYWLLEREKFAIIIIISSEIGRIIIDM